MQSFLLLFLLVAIQLSDAFLPHQRLHSSSSSCFTRKQQQHSLSPLFGILEWRAMSLETDRTLLLLPFRLEKEALLLPGQMRTVLLKEGRFFDLLDDATEEPHCSVIGTPIFGEDGFLPMMPLCEISSYEVDAGYRGKVTVSVTLKCMGRAHLSQFQQLKPYMIGQCQQVLDSDSSDTTTTTTTMNGNDRTNPEEEYLDYANNLVQDIEQLLATTMPTKQSMYQQNFWLALNALDYKPTALLSLTTRDNDTPSQKYTNSKKEIEAASWAAVSTLEDNAKVYQALTTTDLIERLQIALRSSMEDSYNHHHQNYTMIPTHYFESGFE
jgi:hypothetical protein